MKRGEVGGNYARLDPPLTYFVTKPFFFSRFVLYNKYNAKGKSGWGAVLFKNM